MTKEYAFIAIVVAIVGLFSFLLFLMRGDSRRRGYGRDDAGGDDPAYGDAVAVDHGGGSHYGDSASDCSTDSGGDCGGGGDGGGD